MHNLRQRTCERRINLIICAFVPTTDQQRALSCDRKKKHWGKILLYLCDKTNKNKSTDKLCFMLIPAYPRLHNTRNSHVHHIFLQIYITYFVNKPTIWSLYTSVRRRYHEVYYWFPFINKNIWNIFLCKYFMIVNYKIFHFNKMQLKIA